MTVGKTAVIRSLEDVAANVVPAGTGTSIQVLIGADVAPNFAMRCFTIEPGGGVPAHTNTVEHEQYVISGRGNICIGDQESQVSAGDVVFIPAGVPHWYNCAGDEPFKFLCLIPNEQDTITFMAEG
ncbi:MAG: cupin domain-containing protein [Desulfobulbaceae bacterium]|uniref:Cupin domain-containing protein n=1 Tax=Candidatus Desulfatifera sulfidica TaxID=2841691 RepID=A0A8J6NBK6_9BACT|nr:cupin domain-containing protein [Candidatus Desulfatifera sulfidica]